MKKQKTIYLVQHNGDGGLDLTVHLNRESAEKSLHWKCIPAKCRVLEFYEGKLRKPPTRSKKVPT